MMELGEGEEGAQKSASSIIAWFYTSEKEWEYQIQAPPFTRGPALYLNTNYYHEIETTVLCSLCYFYLNKIFSKGHKANIQ